MALFLRENLCMWTVLSLMDTIRIQNLCLTRSDQKAKDPGMTSSDPVPLLRMSIFQKSSNKHGANSLFLGNLVHRKLNGMYPIPASRLSSRHFLKPMVS